MKKRKRCVNCQFFERENVDGGIGICRKYGFPVMDTLSGCAPKKTIIEHPPRMLREQMKGAENDEKETVFASRGAVACCSAFCRNGNWMRSDAQKRRACQRCP